MLYPEEVNSAYVDTPYCRYPSAAAIPGTRRWHHDRLAGTRDHANHLVGILLTLGQGMPSRPDVKLIPAHDHWILNAEVGTTRKDNLTGTRTEILRPTCAQPLDPPVLGIERGTAKVQEPVTIRRHVQSRAFQ
jgi:hypothetical protein